MTRYMLTEPAFIASALLAAGSIITDEDLPEGPERDATGALTGKIIRSKPPRSSIEVDDNGQPINEQDRIAAASLPAPETMLDAPTDTAAAEAIAQAGDEKRADGADAIAAAAKAATQPQRRGADKA